MRKPVRAALTRRLLPPQPLPPPQSWPQTSPPTPLALACEASPFLAALSGSYRCIDIGRRFSTEDEGQRAAVASDGPRDPSEAAATAATAAAAATAGSAASALPATHPFLPRELPPGWQRSQHVSSGGKSYTRYHGCATPL